MEKPQSFDHAALAKIHKKSPESRRKHEDVKQAVKLSRIHTQELVQF